MAETLTNLNILYWLSWLLIGLLLAIYISKPFFSRRVISVTVILGVLGSLLGGLGSCCLFGCGTAQYFIISDFCALLVSGLILWFAIYILTGRKK